ncbi:hypothetical protein OUZ56_002295 [Daphnia magna]|uniref:Uncharacterized protein n=1 Tax=Daphnia magna TaxID=35525 RepID=A0ABR0A5M8_9CRUS|nr:hypothetical protein OUZ56_002295 [Daphnia magna]
MNVKVQGDLCISGLPSFLWPRFPLTCDKPVGGHAPTVISSKGCECAVRKGDVGVLKFYDIIGGRRGYPQIRITESNLYFTACLADTQPLSHKSHIFSYCFALSFSVACIDLLFTDYKYNQLQPTTSVPQLVVIR